MLDSLRSCLSATIGFLNVLRIRANLIKRTHSLKYAAMRCIDLLAIIGDKKSLFWALRWHELADFIAA